MKDCGWVTGSGTTGSGTTASGWTRAAGAAMIAVMLAACGDAATTDNRGYTKAPLEKPGVLIGAERPGDMSRYGSPNRVVATEIRLPEETQVTAPTGPTAPVDLPAGVTQDMVDQGQQIFAGAGTCFACHGQGGAGTPLAPALNDTQWLNVSGDYESIVQVVTDGVPVPVQAAVAMPPRGGAQLTEEQVRQVAAYVYSISR